MYVCLCIANVYGITLVRIHTGVKADTYAQVKCNSSNSQSLVNNGYNER